MPLTRAMLYTPILSGDKDNEEGWWLGWDKFSFSFSLCSKAVLIFTDSPCQNNMTPKNPSAENGQFMLCLWLIHMLFFFFFISSLQFSCNLYGLLGYHWQLNLLPALSIFSCFPQPSGSWQTLVLSTLWCCLPTYCLFFFPLSSYLVRCFLPGQMIVGCGRSTSVFASWPLSGGLHMVRWLVRSCCRPFHW